ncbi:MAG TPA: hypothetical protein VNJ53_13085 [Gaiellaceae bacterium]|nr:hypothetical protein [Gaiellaceae bacterium]
MTTTNGHLPEGASYLTLELLERAGTMAVRCPATSARLGQDVYVRVRALRRAEYLALLPPPAPEAAQWAALPPEEQRQRVAAWLAGLPWERQLEWRRAHDEVALRIVSAAAVEPKLTPEAAAWLGEDVDALAQAVLEFSGLLPAAAATEAAAAGA